MGYIDLVNQFIYKQPLLTSKFDALGENDSFLKGNGWQDSVKTIFFQSSVPTGWTLVTGHNDRFLRIVSNTGENIGGFDGGTTLVSTGLVLAHTHNSLSDVNHNHGSILSHSHNIQSGSYGSNSLGSNYPVGIGDQAVNKYVASSGAGTEQGVWRNYFNSAPYDIAATTSDGIHSHSVVTSLGTILPAYIDVIIGQKNSGSGYTDFTNYFSHNDKIKFEAFALVSGLFGNDEYNKGRITPTGTIGIFYQSGALQGWTKLVSYNDRALRVVSGAGGGSGGSLGTSQTIILAHTHSTSSSGSHSHSGGNHRHNVANYPNLKTIYSGVYFFMTADGENELRPTNNSGTIKNCIKGRTTVGGGGTLSTDPNHSHILNSSLSNIILAYFDCIQCSKNSTGAPYAYEDLTSAVLYKKLVSKQKLNKFAKNDEYIRYHTMPAGSIMSFYQSTTPANWVLISTQNDKVLRVTTGAGGGSGGNFAISGAVPLAHTHTPTTYTHQHTLPAHNHDFDMISQAAGDLTANRYIMSPGAGEVHVGTNTGVSGETLKAAATSNAASVGSYAHNHGTSSSSLSNINFAYSNVMLAQKT